MSALSKQVGGTHYKKYPIQPMEFAAIFNLNMPQGLVLKYITRHQDKAKKEDLEKAIHVCELASELHYYAHPCNFNFDLCQRIDAYSSMLCDINSSVELGLYSSLLYSLINSNWQETKAILSNISAIIYGN